MIFGRYVYPDKLAWPASLLDEWEDWLTEQNNPTFTELTDQGTLVYCPKHILEKAPNKEDYGRP